MRFPNEVSHALTLINLYFQIKPKHWLYEPVERFEHFGKEYAWAPDCIFSYQKKVYVCEVQRTRLTQKRWEKKWHAFNLYFNKDHFHSAAFQKWSKTTILPQFLVITSQQPEIVKNGFEIKDRELIVCREFR